MVTLHEALTRTGLVRATAFAAVALMATSAPSFAAKADDPERWATYPASLDEILLRYPSSDANQTAIDVERLAADIGIDVVPKAAERKLRPSADAAAAYEKSRLAVSDYLNEQLTRVDSGVSAPLPGAAGFLLERRDAIEALCARLEHGDPPRWERHLESLNAMRIPNLLGLMNLHRALLADAFLRQSQGDDQGALRDIEASWTRITALRDEPVVIDQLIAIAIARLQAGTLRHVPAAPAGWRDRLREHDYHDSLLAALQVQGWMWMHADMPHTLSLDDSVFTRLGLVVGEPYLRACMENTAEIWSRQLVRLARSRALCGVATESLEAETLAEIPWWNRFGGDVVKNLPGAMLRSARFDLDVELTARVLELRAAKRDAGSWPAALMAEAESEACPGARWIYEIAPGNERSIALDRDVTWPGQVGAILPNRYVTSRRDRE